MLPLGRGSKKKASYCEYRRRWIRAAQLLDELARVCGLE
jgi:hypothetical protein